MRITHSERMAVETEERREARLQRMRANQSERLAAETEQQREARLQRDREGQQQPQLPLFLFTTTASVAQLLFSLSPFTYSHVLQHSMRSSGSPHTVPYMTLVIKHANFQGHAHSRVDHAHSRRVLFFFVICRA